MTLTLTTWTAQQPTEHLPALRQLTGREKLLAQLQLDVSVLNQVCVVFSNKMALSSAGGQLRMLPIDCTVGLWGLPDQQLTDHYHAWGSELCLLTSGF